MRGFTYLKETTSLEKVVIQIYEILRVLIISSNNYSELQKAQMEALKILIDSWTEG